MSALVRKIDRYKPTLLLDESDAAFEAKSGDYSEALRGILNTGFERDGAYTMNVPVGNSWEPRDFSTFAAKAIAGIGNTLAAPDMPARGNLCHHRHGLELGAAADREGAFDRPALDSHGECWRVDGSHFRIWIFFEPRACRAAPSMARIALSSAGDKGSREENTSGC